MRNGAIDSHDPNYSSSGSDDEPEHRATVSQPTRPGSVPTPSTLQQQQQPPPAQATSFKRIGLEELFAAQQTAAAASSAATMTAPSSLPSSALPSPGLPTPGLPVGAAEKRKSEQYAGGAHHNIPEASALPLPASLNSTPQKQHSRPGQPPTAAAAAAASPDAALRMEQSLKALLRINS